MFTVLKSFATKDVIGTKGKPINISDKKLADELKKVGYITDLRKKDILSAEKDNEIADLKITIDTLNIKVSELESEKQDLLNKIEELANFDITDDEKKVDDENQTPLTENNDENKENESSDK